MTFPEKIVVRVVAGSDALPVMGAVLSLRLTMPLKNSYSIGPRFTDEHGCATFEASEIVQEVQLCQKVSPMDYCGTIEDCSSLELAVLGKDDIQRLTAARKLWGQGVPEWKLRERDLSALRHAQNNLAFVNSLRVVVDELTLKREIILQITTTSDSQSNLLPPRG